MDDIIDLELEKIDKILKKINTDPEENDIKYVEYKLWQKIRENAVNLRRQGIGILAKADCMAALNYSIDPVEIHKQMAINIFEASIDLAEERGCFPIANFEKDMVSDFNKRIYNLLSLEYQDKYRKYNKRNAGLLSIAPTGTIALMAKLSKYYGTASGGEPVYAISYNRKRKVANGEVEDFTDNTGQKWKNYAVYHSGYQEWKKINFNMNCDEEYYEGKYIIESPYFKHTALDMDWKQSVIEQGAIQQYIDHSISRSVNLPNETTIETIDELYKLAWKSGCKGITIYRDGSREGVLTTGKEIKQNIPIIVERPQSVPCDIHHVVADGHAWMILVGILENKPYELFALRVKSDEEMLKEGGIQLSKSTTKGNLIKIESGIYNLITDGGVIFNLKTQYKSSNEQIITRLTSKLFRYIPIVEIVSDFEKTPSHISSIVAVIQRVLSKYIGTVETKLKCPECSIGTLVNKNGCLYCSQCNYSPKCS